MVRFHLTKSVMTIVSRRRSVEGRRLLPDGEEDCQVDDPEDRGDGQDDEGGVLQVRTPLLLQLPLQLHLAAEDGEGELVKALGARAHLLMTSCNTCFRCFFSFLSSTPPILLLQGLNLLELIVEKRTSVQIKQLFSRKISSPIYNLYPPALK